jgi:hypothetical protein
MAKEFSKKKKGDLEMPPSIHISVLIDAHDNRNDPANPTRKPNGKRRKGGKWHIEVLIKLETEF